MCCARLTQCRYLAGRLVLALVVAASLACNASAAVRVLYGTTYPDATDLYALDQTSGTATSIGNSGPDSIGDLTSDTRPGSETIWGMRISSNELYTIDPSSGVATLAATLNSPYSIASIAFDVVSAKLYGNTSVGFDAPSDVLYEINPATGNTTPIGPIGFVDVFALGFDQSGQLFGVSDVTKQLISIDTETGNGTLIGTIDLLQVFDIASRPEDDVMFVADTVAATLYTIDTATGFVTAVGPYGAALNVAGLAFSTASLAVVPEPAALVVWSILVGLGLSVVARHGKRAWSRFGVRS